MNRPSHIFEGSISALAAETEIVTRQGVVRIGDAANTSRTILTVNGRWRTATVRCLGEQILRKVILHRRGDQKEVYATPGQVWFARSQTDISHNRGHRKVSTDELSPGYRIQYLFGQSLANSGASPVGIMHGIVFGDGTRTESQSEVRLCGDKRELLSWFPNHPVSMVNDQQTRVSRLPWSFKELPRLDESRSYLYGWLVGLMATDGSCSANSGAVTISSARREVLELVRGLCSIIGIGTYKIASAERVSNLTGRNHVIHRVSLMRDTLTNDFFLRTQHRTNFEEAGGQDIVRRYWRVLSVEKVDRHERVFSLVAPQTKAFVIADNILVGATCDGYEALGVGLDTS